MIMTTTKYKVGDAVVFNGYPGTVRTVDADGMLEVRLERGDAHADPSDVLPGEVWPQLVKMGESDARKAKREGSILIASTLYGTLDLRYDATAKHFEGYVADELHPRGGHCVLSAGTIKQAGTQLASLYRIEVG